MLLQTRSQVTRSHDDELCPDRHSEQGFIPCEGDLHNEQRRVQNLGGRGKEEVELNRNLDCLSDQNWTRSCHGDENQRNRGQTLTVGAEGSQGEFRASCYRSHEAEDDCVQERGHS